MSGENQAANRPLVGVLSVGCLAAAGVLWWQFSEAGQAGWANGAIGALVRVGIVFAALWFALPGRFGTAIGSKISPKVFLIVLGGLALITARRGIALVIMPALFLLGFAALIAKPRMDQR